MKEGQEDELGGSSLNSSSRLPNIYSNTRPFPAQAPTVDTGYVRFENLVRNLKNELLQTKNKADVDLYKRDLEIAGMRKIIAEQRETIDGQKEQIKDLQRALRDYQVTDSKQQRTMARSSNSAEAQLRQLRNQLRELELTHERESAAAAAALDRARKEKAALAMGLAAVAQQALGGPEASAEDLASDMEAAVAEGSEPLPRNPSAWAQLKFELDDKGNLASFSRTPGTFLRPFDRDGARAVAALCAQVARLHRQRASFRASGRDAAEALARVQGVLDSIDSDFAVVGAVVEELVNGVEGAAAACGLPALLGPLGMLALGRAGGGKVSDQLRAVWQAVQALSGELLALYRPRPPEEGPALTRDEALEIYRQESFETTGKIPLGEYDALLAALRGIPGAGSGPATGGSQRGGSQRPGPGYAGEGEFGGGSRGGVGSAGPGPGSAGGREEGPKQGQQQQQQQQRPASQAQAGAGSGPAAAAAGGGEAGGKEGKDAGSSGLKGAGAGGGGGSGGGGSHKPAHRGHRGSEGGSTAGEVSGDIQEEGSYGSRV